MLLKGGRCQTITKAITNAQMASMLNEIEVLRIAIGYGYAG